MNTGHSKNKINNNKVEICAKNNTFFILCTIKIRLSILKVCTFENIANLILIFLWLLIGYYVVESNQKLKRYIKLSPFKIHL